MMMTFIMIIITRMIVIIIVVAVIIVILFIITLVTIISIIFTVDFLSPRARVGASDQRYPTLSSVSL